MQPSPLTAASVAARPAGITVVDAGTAGPDGVAARAPARTTIECSGTDFSPGGVTTLLNTTTPPSSDTLGDVFSPASGVPFVAIETTPGPTVEPTTCGTGSAPRPPTTPTKARPTATMVPTRAHTENGCSDVGAIVLHVFPEAPSEAGP